MTAPQNHDWETLLCRAIQDRLQVELRYKDDTLYRAFSPYAVYNSTQNKVNVSGTQTANPNAPLKPASPHVFEVGNITALRVSGDHFEPDPRFDSFDARYQNGIICSIQSI